jgi:hypothetical protein
LRPSSRYCADRLKCLPAQFKASVSPTWCA